MKHVFLTSLIAVALFLMPKTNLAQAPDLGMATSFAVFTATGAFNNLGTTSIVGDIGTNSGAFSGFPPGVVLGSIHVVDGVSAQAAIDTDDAYADVAGLTCGAVIGVTLGNGQILTPNIYCTGAASTLNGNLTLDGEGDPDALFIFQIDGAFATSTFASVTLINGASLCNVYWQINGEFDLGDFSVFLGTVLVNGAINLLEGSSLTGRVLSRAGAISLFSNTITIGLPAEAAVITASGPTSFCIGGSVTLSGNIDGVWNTGETTPSITVTVSGEYFVTNTTVCGIAQSNHIIVTVNPLPVCSITGDLDICSGELTELCAPAGMAFYVWSTGALTQCITVTTSGVYIVGIVDLNGCNSTCLVTVVANPLPVCSISGDLDICVGESTELCAPLGFTYLWSTGEITNCITVSLPGIYSVVLVDVNGCSSTCSVEVTVNALPVCAITGNLAICGAGATTELCASPGASAYLWSTGELTACITVSLGGLYTVTIIDANGCSSTCSVTVVVNPLPVCSITGDLSLCTGSFNELCGPMGMSGYLWSTGETTNCILVSTGGIYTLTVTDLNGCSSTCSVTVVANLLPVCTITGNLLLCNVGQTTELCAPPGNAYLWSTGEVTACITVGLAGIYTVTLTDLNGCTSTCSVEVIFDPLPVCNITGDLLLCDGESTELCVPPGAASYLWSNGEITNCITVSLPGIYFVVVTEANGCTSNCSVTVTVNPLPVCTITGDLSICQGASTELCGPAGFASYLWSTGETTNCIMVGTGGIYTLTVTDLNGCSSTCDVTVVVNLLPVCSITGDLLLCDAGQTTNLCAPLGYTYMWSTGEVTACINVGLAGIYSVTLMDLNGCTSTCSVEVILDPLPVCSITGDLLLCGGESTELCVPPGAAAYLWSTGATTNCITVSLSGIYSVVVTQANGCTSTCSVTVTVEPAPACVITGDLLLCQGESTELCVPPGAAGYLWSTGATTNCITVTLPGIYTVVITEASGCMSTCSVTVVVTPLPPCTITGNLLLCESLTTELCVSAGAAGYLWSTGATTNCITVSLPGIYSVVVTEANGCISTCSVTVTADSTPPVITCPADLAIECDDSTLPLDTGVATATDNCTLAPTITFSDAVVEGICPQEYTITRTWLATDAFGNTSTCVQTITVGDNTPPVIACPENITVQCAIQIPAINIGFVVATDNCGGTVAVAHVSDVITNQICENNFTLIRTYGATDLCGNTATCVQVIAVLDNTPPEITFPAGFPIGDTIKVQCYGQDPEWDIPSFNNGGILATDNCTGPVTLVYDEVLLEAGDCVDGFINLYRLSWTATDDCGNSASAFIFLALVDTIAPVIFGVPLDITVNCNEIPDAPDFIYAIDECLCACIVLLEETLPVPGCQFGQVIVRTWRATDDCGNQTIATQRITLMDDEPPVIVGVLDTACFNDPRLFDVLAIDNCGGPTVLVFQDFNTPNPCGSGNAIRRIYEAYDNCGNVSRDTAILLPNDQSLAGLAFVNPILIALDSGEVLTIDAFGPNGQYTAFGINDVRFDGACFSGGVVNFTETVLETGDCSTEGFLTAIELKWTAVDVCGNFSELSIIVHVVDETSPEFVNFTAEITIGCDEELPQNFGTDNSGEVTMTIRDTTIRGDCIYDYDVLRSIELRDSCGNSTTREQIIHVRSSAPVISGVVDEICDDLTIPEVSAFDPCAGEFVEVTMQEDTLDIPCSGLSIVRTWTAIGSCGHVAEIRQTIIMNDTIPPVITIPALSVILPFLDQPYNVVLASEIYIIEQLNDLEVNSVIITDDCDQGILPVLTAKITYAENCEAEGYFERRMYAWMATDACGNTATFSFTVDIIDDLAPTFSVTPEDITIICAPLPPVPEVHAVDQAQPGTVIFTETTVPGTAPGVFIVTRTWVATDACGNTSTFVQHITWIPDTFLECEIVIPPVVECNSHGVIITSVVTGGVGPITYEWEVVGDNCFIQGGQGTPEIIIYVGWTTVKIILTVTDSNGCTSMCMVLLNCVNVPVIPLSELPALSISESDTESTPGAVITSTPKDFLQQIKLWPNPASGSVNLSFISSAEEVVEFRFINLLGQVMLSEKINARIGLNAVTIDVARVSEGSHLVQIKTEQEVHSKVIVILEND